MTHLFYYPQMHNQVKLNMMHDLFRCLWLFNPFFDGVYSHVIVGIVNTHEDIISSYDLQFWVLQPHGSSNGCSGGGAVGPGLICYQARIDFFNLKTIY
jgi:hypothetical protein